MRYWCERMDAKAHCDCRMSDRDIFVPDSGMLWWKERGIGMYESSVFVYSRSGAETGVWFHPCWRRNRYTSRPSLLEPEMRRAVKRGAGTLALTRTQRHRDRHNDGEREREREQRCLLSFRNSTWFWVNDNRVVWRGTHEVATEV